MTKDMNGTGRSAVREFAYEAVFPELADRMHDHLDRAYGRRPSKRTLPTQPTGLKVDVRRLVGFQTRDGIDRSLHARPAI